MIVQSKRASYAEEEIEVKPSTELIPDEYEHFQESQGKIIVHTFASEDEDDKQNEVLFLTSINDFGYQINRHSLENDDFGKIIGEITRKSNKLDAGLILYFSGFVKQNGQLEIWDGKRSTTVDIQQIWTNFNSHNCPNLKNRPKIFIFNLFNREDSIQTDSKMGHFGTVQSAYDTPAEADILVVCNKSYNGENNDFMETFCANIKEYGDVENIITLATCVYSSTTTLIISTLTRNFFFTASNLRGHHLVIEKHTESIVNHIKELKETLNKKVEKKEKRYFFDSFRRKPKIEEDSTSKLNPVKVFGSTPVTNSKPSSSTNVARKPSWTPPRQRLFSQGDESRPSMRKSGDKKDKPKWRN